MSIASRLVAVLILGSTSAFAAPAWERVITPAAPGINRILPDAPVLAHTKPLVYANGSWTGGLEDLRLYTRDGREVAYVVEPPVSPKYVWRAGSILPIAPTKISSGFEIDLGTAANVDRLRVEGLPRPVMKRFTLEGSGDRARWTLLAHGTIFDLPDEALQQTEYPFPAGSYRYLRVTWDDRSSARVPMPSMVSARTAAALLPPPAMVQLPFTRQAAPRAESHFRVQLPGRNLPIVALHVVTSEPNLFRTAKVTEARFNGREVNPYELGKATLKEKAAGDVSAAELRIPVGTPASSVIDLTVEDGSNPPLKLQSVFAELAPLPTIYFDTPDTTPVVARFGDPSIAAAPRYDLEALRGDLAARASAAAAWGQLRAAAPQENVMQAPVVPAGGPIDASRFRYNRKLGGQEKGFSSVQLDADVLSRSRDDLNDVRIVTPDNRQIPYVVERAIVPLSMPLKIAQEKSGENDKSVYSIELPYDRMPGASIRIATDTPLFQRHLTIEAIDEKSRDERRVIDSRDWTRTDAETQPSAFSVNLPDSGIEHLRITVDEGDNEPLHLADAQLLLPGVALRFFHPGGPLRLVYGSNDVTTRHYDLALLGATLYDRAAREVALAPAVKGVTAVDWFLRIFWIVLGLAVAFLLFILVRLLTLPVPYELRSGPTADKLYKNNKDRERKFE